MVIRVLPPTKEAFTPSQAAVVLDAAAAQVTDASSAWRGPVLLQGVGDRGPEHGVEESLAVAIAQGQRLYPAGFRVRPFERTPDPDDERHEATRLPRPACQHGRRRCKQCQPSQETT